MGSAVRLEPSGWTIAMMAKQLIGKALAVAIIRGFFAGLIAVVAVPLELRKMAEAQASPARRGVIMQSSASEVFSRRRGNRWTYVIRGRFLDTGDPFALTRVRYGDFLLGRRKADSLATVATYPVGREEDVYSNPTSPREMILEPFVSRRPMLVTLGVGIGLVALPGVLFLCRKRRAGPDREGTGPGSGGRGT